MTHPDQVDPAAVGMKSGNKVLDAVFGFLAGTFVPLLPAITGAALVQVVALLLVQFGALEASDPTYLVLHATGNAIFYFLPVFVAYTASGLLGANPFIGATIAAVLLHPSFTNLGAPGEVIPAFGLPLFLTTYASTMFPSLLLALALGGLDRLLRRWVPESAQAIANPALELLLLAPLTALVLGPVGAISGQWIGSGVAWLANTAPWAFYLVVPTFWIFLVLFGMHWALVSIALLEIAQNGESAILGASFGMVYAVVGVAIGVLIKASRDRDKPVRDIAAAAAIAVAIGGISEPTLYGLILRYRKLLIIEMIAAASAGVMLAIGKVTMVAFAIPPVLGLPAQQPTWAATLALLTATLVAVGLVLTWGYENPDAPPSR